MSIGKEGEQNRSERVRFLRKMNGRPASLFFSFSSSPRVPKNKKSVFYVFYGTLRPKVECQFEFFSININYEAVSSRKSSVRSVHKYQGSIRPSVGKIGEGKETNGQNAISVTIDSGELRTHNNHAHILCTLTLVISIDAA